MNTRIFGVELTETAPTIPDLEARFNNRLDEVIATETALVTLVQNEPARLGYETGGVRFYTCTRVYQIDLDPPAPELEPEIQESTDTP